MTTQRKAVEQTVLSPGRTQRPAGVACSRPRGSRFRGIENTKIKRVTRSYFRVPLTYATSLLCESLETARPGETTAKC